MAVKNRLLDIRLRMGYKLQKDFAVFLGVDHTHYNRWENNKIQPDIDKIIDILNKLNMKFEEVFYKVAE